MPALTIHLFARARDLAGCHSLAVDVRAGSTVADLRHHLAERIPALSALLERSAVAVNHEFAEESRVLTAGDEVAIIPPVSGG